MLFSGKYDHDYIREKFYKYVESTVSRFCEQNISAHTLNISADIENSKEIELFERCIDLVLDKGLQMMDIRFGYHDENLTMFCLPDTLLSASSLTSLKLKECELPLSLMAGVVKFNSLRQLSLSDLPIDEGVIEHLIKGCPLLEEIYLKHCYGFETFCVKWHQNLLKVEIYSDERLLLEIIDVEAPNLRYFVLDIESNEDKPHSVFMDSCKKLTTFCYLGFPLQRFNEFLSNFPFLENVSLSLSSPVDNLKLSHHFLRRLELRSDCDLEEIDLNAPNLLSFEYRDIYYWHDFKLLSREDSSLSKGCMKCEALEDYSDIRWFEKLRKFLDKNSIFNVLKLNIHPQIHWPPYELEHVDLKFERETQVYVALVDAVIWCCRPRSLTLQLEYFTENGVVVVEYTYEKLLQQEDEGQTNIKFVLKSYSKCEQPFSFLNSLLKALSLLPQFRGKITFIKEEVVKPPHCTECKSFGHSLNTCPENVKEADPTTATMEELNEGFTEVIRRKNKGKMFDQRAKSGHVSGIQLNKPKSIGFCRHKLVKENAHGKGSSMKPKEHGVASTSNTKSSVHFNISNSFEALNSLDENGNGLHAPDQCVHIVKEVNEGLASKPSSSRGDLRDESDENEVLLRDSV